MVAAAGAGGLLLVLLGVWVIVRDKEGKEVARVPVPQGGSVTVETEKESGDAKPSVPWKLPAGAPPSKDRPTPTPATPAKTPPAAKPVAPWTLPASNPRDHRRRQLLHHAGIQPVADLRHPQGVGDRLLVQLLQRLAEHPHLLRRTELVDHPLGRERLPQVRHQARHRFHAQIQENVVPKNLSRIS